MEELNYLMTMSPQTDWHLRIHNVNHPVTSTPANQGIVHKLITYPGTTLPHVAFPSGIWGFLECESPILVLVPLQ